MDNIEHAIKESILIKLNSYVSRYYFRNIVFKDIPENIKEIVLDFSDVEMIGKCDADELNSIANSFKTRGIPVRYENMNQYVRFLIEISNNPPLKTKINIDRKNKI